MVERNIPAALRRRRQACSGLVPILVSRGRGSCPALGGWHGNLQEGTVLRRGDVHRAHDDTSSPGAACTSCGTSGTSTPAHLDLRTSTRLSNRLAPRRKGPYATAS